MNEKKIIFVTETPVTIKLKELFFLDVFERNGFELECWNVHDFYYKHLNSLPDILTSSHIFSFSNMKEVKDRLKLHSRQNTIILLGLDDYFLYRKFFRLFTKHKFLIAAICPYAGISSLPFTFKEKIMRALSSNIFKKIIPQIQNTYYHFYKKFHKIDLISYRFSSTQPRSFAINHLDYEHFIKIKDNKDKVYDKDYIVFLDTYMPLHPDLRVYNALKYIKPENYQSSLRNFFDKIEQKFQAEVIIAAHPKAVYDNNEFGNRKIIKYKTNLLVKDAKLVVTQMSNSNAFVLLFNKPVIFITTTEIDRTPKIAFKLHTYANYLNKQVYNIDEYDVDKMEFSEIDIEYRNRYIYYQLTSLETEHLTNEEILVKEYNKIFDKIKKLN